MHWHVAMPPGKRKELDKDNNPIDMLIDKMEKSRAASGQRWSPVSGHQASVWLRESAPPGFKEKQAADQGSVCAVQSVDGAAQAAWDSGRCAPKSRSLWPRRLAQRPTGFTELRQLILVAAAP